MPFTLSHAAAAWPFRRSRLVLTAMIFGCFAPDCEYFFHVAPQGGIGHTPAGIFLFSLPVGVALFLIFHLLVERPMILLLPAGFRARAEAWLRPLPRKGLAGAALVVASVLTGVMTHVFWDSFTHYRGWFYSRVWWLRQQVELPMMGSQSHVEILQNLSTLAGGLVLIFWLRSWYRKTPPLIPTRPAGVAIWIARVVIPLLALAGALWRSWTLTSEYSGASEYEYWLVCFVVAMVSYFCLGLLLWALVCRIFLRRLFAEHGIQSWRQGWTLPGTPPPAADVRPPTTDD